MEIPLGSSFKTTEGKVCKLKKPFFVLRQSPTAWFYHFNKAIINFGFWQSVMSIHYFLDIKKVRLSYSLCIG